MHKLINVSWSYMLEVNVEVKPSRLLSACAFLPRALPRLPTSASRCVLPSRQVIPSFFTLLLAFPSAAELRFFTLHLLRVYLGLCFYMRKKYHRKAVCISQRARLSCPLDLSGEPYNHFLYIYLSFFILLHIFAFKISR